MNDEQLFKEFLEFKRFKESQSIDLSDKKPKKKKKYTQRQDGRYETKVTIGRDTDTGKPIRVPVYGDTIAELENNKADIKSDVNKGIYIKQKKVTLGDYAKKWLEVTVPNLAMNTRKMYTRVVNLYLLPLYDVFLLDLTKSDIQMVINKNSAHPRTCEQIKITINQILNAAIDDKLLLVNPCRKIKLPKKSKSCKRPLTSQEEILTERADFTDREKAYIYVIKYFGLRKEEALALCKNDFDFDQDTLTIRNTVVFEHNQPLFIDGTKSEKGNRALPIPSCCKMFLRYYISVIPYNHLFYCLRNGNLITESSFKKMWKSIITKMNDKAEELQMKYTVNGLTSHIFRHNYCTILYYAGIGIKEAQDLMGHADAKMTIDVYTHLDESGLKHSKSKLNVFLESRKD